MSVSPLEPKSSAYTSSATFALCFQQDREVRSCRIVPFRSNIVTFLVTFHRAAASAEAALDSKLLPGKRPQTNTPDQESRSTRRIKFFTV